MAKRYKIKKTAKKSLLQRKSSPEKTDTPQEDVKKIKVRVIGVGGGGGSIVSELASKVKKASFVAANTDYQALRTVNKNCLRFQFGEKFTQGLGTGMNPDLAREAAEEEKERIKKLFEGQDLCVLVVSLGGGAGSGAGPVFAKIARQTGSLTLGILTLPFSFEGEKKVEIAKDSLQKLRFNLNAISILPNERIFQIINKDAPLKEALSAINKNLAESLEGLIEAIYQPGLINIDFADLKTILQGQGRFAYLNTVEGKESGLEAQVIQKVLNCQLYPYTIRGAKGVLFNIIGEKELSISDVSKISKTISDMINPQAKIIFGISQNKKYQDKIKVSLLATGCQFKVFSEAGKKHKRIFKRKPAKVVSPQPVAAKENKVEKEAEIKPPKNKSRTFARSGMLNRSEDYSKVRDKFFNKKEKKEEIIPPKGDEKKFSSSPFAKARVGDEKKFSSSSFAYRSESEEKKPAAVSLKEKTEILVRPSEKKIESKPPHQTGTESIKLNVKVSSPRYGVGVKVRKNALQVKKEVEEAEKELIEEEKIWETPAFLRQKSN